MSVRVHVGGRVVFAAAACRDRSVAGDAVAAFVARAAIRLRSFYESFPDLTDAEVREVLERSSVSSKARPS